MAKKSGGSRGHFKTRSEAVLIQEWMDNERGLFNGEYRLPPVHSFDPRYLFPDISRSQVADDLARVEALAEECGVPLRAEPTLVSTHITTDETDAG